MSCASIVQLCVAWGFNKFVKIKDSGFLEYVHAFVYFIVHESIRGDVYVVFVPYFLGNLGWVGV